MLSRTMLSRQVAGALAMFILFGLPAYAETDQGGNQLDIITKLQESSQAVVWRIDRPNVKHPVMTYPTIRFLPGDAVKIVASGCVQTGGMGRTWKRYVDPSGPNADRLYHGLIGIPGVPPVKNSLNSDSGLSRLQLYGLNTVEHVIPSPIPPNVNPNQLFLTLGYEDDGYGDNGYWGHDDGTGNQCQNVDAAYLIISIGHNGALPPDPGLFVGIEPNNFRCQAAWAFHNFDTSSLSWSSFANAFSLDFWDYVDPLTYATYLAGRGLANGGNCEGMSLLSIVGEDQFVVNDIKEAFWANYKPQTSGQPAAYVASDVNVAHWKQLSTYFLHNWLDSVWNHPATNAAAIEHDLTRADNAYNYGLVSIANGFSGHVLVPLAVSHSGNQTLIEVYDPNRPCGSIPDKSKYPKIVITGDNWSYDMGGSDGTWTGSNGPTSGMAYIPYVGEDGWSNLGTNLSGLVQVVFGGNTNVEQVATADGRKLFVEGRPGVLDLSDKGLAHDVVRLPTYSVDTKPKRPRSDGPRFILDHALKLTPEQTLAEQKMQEDYAGDFDASKQIYLIANSKLSDVTFQLAGKSANQPVHAIVGQAGNFFEIKASSTNANVVHPALTIHSIENFGSGVTVAEAKGAPQKLTILRGVVSREKKTVQVETSDQIAASGPILARSAGDASLELLNASGGGEAKITGHVFNETGAVSDLVERTAAFGKLQ